MIIFLCIGRILVNGRFRPAERRLTWLCAVEERESRASQTDEELRKWATDENLQEGKKALFLISRGFPQQKTAVLSSLQRLAAEREFTDILLFVFVTCT